MHSNFIWRVFLAIVLAATVWHTAVTIYRYSAFSRLNAHTQVSKITWTVEKQAEDAFTLKASYKFLVNNRPHVGFTHFTEETYRNQWAAEQSIQERSNRQWTVWYDKDDPNNSSLQKKFPLKECISAVVLWALSIYFLWLGYYVTTFKTQ